MDSIRHRISMSLSLSSYADHEPELLKKLNAMHGHPEGVPLDQKAPPALLFAHYAIRQYIEVKLEATITQGGEITYRVVSPATTPASGLDLKLFNLEMELEQIRQCAHASAREGTTAAVERRLRHLTEERDEALRAGAHARAVADMHKSVLEDIRRAVGAKDGEHTLDAVQRCVGELVQIYDNCKAREDAVRVFVSASDVEGTLEAVRRRLDEIVEG